MKPMTEMMMPPLNIVPPFTVISGGQTGADLAGLLAAEQCKIPTSGWAPLGFKTEKGPQPLLAQRFRLKEHHSKDYGQRTMANARAACATLILSPNAKSVGTLKTVQSCTAAGRPYLLVHQFNDETTKQVMDWLSELKPSVLNVAGNRESVCPGLTRSARNFLNPIFSYYIQQLNINSESAQ